MDPIVLELNDLNKLISNQSFTDCKTDIVNCSGQLCQEPADTDMDSHSGEAGSSNVSALVADPTPGPREDLNRGIEATLPTI